MNKILLNISQLVGVSDSDYRFSAGANMQKLNILKDAYLAFENGLITGFGLMSEKPDLQQFSEVFDAKNQMVFPSFVDSHTHLVYAGSREIEYIDKIRGLSYEEIAKKGGGILNSAKLLDQTSENDLYFQSLERIKMIISMGTGAVEIKSGYGLTLENELKMLRVIRRLRDTSPIEIKSTFLGAHAVPANYKGRQSEYVKVIINEMLPEVAKQGLADFIDVFCDTGFFTTDETHEILNAADKFGLRPKIHANELDYSGGIEVGAYHNALSVDHLEYTGNAEIMALLKTQTMPTILPGAAFFLGMKYAPARRMIDAGLPVALASDFNPGSSPSGNMQLIASMGSILYKLLPEEVINATTINTAYAMDVADKMGSIAIGKNASFFIAKPIPSLSYFPYSFGDNKVDKVFIKGNQIDICNC